MHGRMVQLHGRPGGRQHLLKPLLLCMSARWRLVGNAETLLRYQCCFFLSEKVMLD